ncbi:YecA family protein [Endozoicomonas montiporae]|uniref:Metal-binding protein n=1 Tax=Endozoicomonas montiporae CL-33 TaxID=570277 RepID=A0A142BF06_9GAMM|nr:YecA family protein [Endozoicomonas montiporae]AMO57332.1 metal-binding protein [Endozoicomonas montiporae CL-33]
MQNTRSTIEHLLTQYSEEEPLNFHAVHGFMTALAICPVDLSEAERNDILFDGQVSLKAEDQQALNQALSDVARSIDRQFNEEEGFTLSCEDELDNPEDEALFDWCGGFMEGHFLNEKQWFVEHEQEVCELLLPVMLASGLFDEEPEFQEILNNEELTEDMTSQIPEVLMELYLLFNSPEEATSKPVTKGTGMPKSKGGKKGSHPRKKR